MPTFDTGTVTIAYDDEGQGSPALLFLHGFSCARSDFVHQLGHFAGRHRVVAFDQRGHGDSSLAADGRYGSAVDAEDARALCRHLGIERPIVVGHSLGGVTALRLAAEPGFASGLVLLDSTIELPAEVTGELVKFIAQLEAASDQEFAEIVGGYARYRMIDPCDDPAVADRLVRRSAAVPRQVYVAGVRSTLEVDITATALAVEVPAMFIASSLPWIDPGRVHELRPSWYHGRTVGAGHFHHLLVAEQVNGMIQRFLDCIAAGFPAAAPSEW